MKITIIGTGYVGLVTGACFANVGHSVCCVDTDEEKIEKLRNGIIPIYEPGLEDIVLSTLRNGNLTVSSDSKGSIEDAEMIFIAVGTPPDEDGRADLQYVLKVAETIGRFMNGPTIVVDKSTVPVGTADKVKAQIEGALRSRNAEYDFHVCSNPEFLKEGCAVEDFNRPARIIIGTDSEHVREQMRICYAPFSRNYDKMIFMDVRSAELTKYAANAMLATKISFINEISRISESVGADIESVRLGIGSDPRIGYQFIYPGAGYGGSCFPKDVQALARTAVEFGTEPILLEAVEAVNNRQKEVLFEKLSASLDGNIEGKQIAIWGLAFKPNTDDMRSAPSLELIESILEAGGTIQAYDPVASDEANRIFKGRTGFETVERKEDALLNSAALVICTEWSEFRVVDPVTLVEKLDAPILIDGRNMFDPKGMEDAGVQYYSIGRVAPSLKN